MTSASRQRDHAVIVSVDRQREAASSGRNRRSCFGIDSRYRTSETKRSSIKRDRSAVGATAQVCAVYEYLVGAPVIAALGRVVGPDGRIVPVAGEGHSRPSDAKVDPRLHVIDPWVRKIPDRRDVV